MKHRFKIGDVVHFQSYEGPLLVWHRGVVTAVYGTLEGPVKLYGVECRDETGAVTTRGGLGGLELESNLFTEDEATMYALRFGNAQSAAWRIRREDVEELPA